MYWLGRCLLAGRGTAADAAGGTAWIAKAAQHGHPIARPVAACLADAARPAQTPAALDAALDAIERDLVLKALSATAEPAGAR